MAFEDSEISIEASEPVEVYEITLGSSVFRFTSAEDDVPVGANTFTALPGLSRSATFAGSDTRDNVFEVRMPADNLFTRRYVQLIPADDALIKVTRFQRNEGTGAGDTLIIFDGVVQSVGFEDNREVAVLACQPAIGALTRPIPRQVFSSGCGHILYDPLTCRVLRTGSSPGGSPIAFELTATVTAEEPGGLILTVPGALGRPNGWFTAGQITAPGGIDTRLVIRHTNDQIRLYVPFPFSLMNSQVTLHAGCAHDPTDCNDKFGNFINYGGFPFVPDRNPFQVGID